MSLFVTSSQTVGPYLRIGFLPLVIDALAPAGTPGQRITVRGHIVDGERKPINDGVLEIWQADAQGRYAHPEDREESDGTIARNAFRGFGRILTDSGGGFQFTTIKPGSVAGPDGARQAPHLVVTLFMRGMLTHLFTRMYFPDEPLNATDSVLQRVPADRRETLISAAPSDKSILEWNIVSQGSGETVFFDF
jgi:protocatechuate 3,4-dioxygenase, alpha subunit